MLSGAKRKEMDSENFSTELSMESFVILEYSYCLAGLGKLCNRGNSVQRMASQCCLPTAPSWPVGLSGDRAGPWAPMGRVRAGRLPSALS